MDTLVPIDAYVLGFQDGAQAAMSLMEPLASGIIDVQERAARLCDPDCLGLSVRKGN